MMNRRIYFSLFLLLVFLSLFTPLFSSAQTIRCGTTLLPSYSQDIHLFEKWLQSSISVRAQGASQVQEVTYQIPVVVHVIHNGEPIGTGSNISDAQIQSQIRILNEDYRKKSGTNGFNTNPVGADVNIEFSLAGTSPQNTNTNGIVRIKGTKSSWSLSDNDTLKSLSYWNSAEYLNIWVCNLKGVLGYAQFPESALQGLSSNAQNPLTDGVVINYQYFGDIGTKSPFNLGRTATHEIGHFLGLRHIWGDLDNCLGTDYCDDTPPAQQENRGCPSTPRQICDPTKAEMIQNYLDYTDDACMNIFTQDQKTRMRTVLENCPRRNTLINSPGLQVTASTGLDAGIERIIPLNNNGCSGNITPSVSLRNYGTTVLTSTDIIVNIDGKNTSTYRWAGNLNSLERITLNLNAMTISNGTHQISISTQNPNNGLDLNPSNDLRSMPFKIEQIQSLPFAENFISDTLGLNSKWTVLNSDYDITWQHTSFDSLDKVEQGVYLNFYNYNKKTGQSDYLISPPMDLSLVKSCYLVCDYAYSPFYNSFGNTYKQDGLRILASTDCGQQFSTVLFEKYGYELGTVSPSTMPFIPQYKGQWQRIKIDLSAWAGNPSFKIAFQGINGYGNNLYLKNIQFITEDNFSAENKLMNLYPNPTGNDFYVDFDLPSKTDILLQVFSTSGALIFENTYVGTQKNIYHIQLQSSYKGVFLLKASGDGVNFQKKIVLE